VLNLAWLNFNRELSELVKQIKGEGYSTLDSPGPVDDSPGGAAAAASAVVNPEAYLVGAFDGSQESLAMASKRYDPAAELRREGLHKLVLSNRNVTHREIEREKQPGSVVAAPLVLKVPYIFLCAFIDAVFEDRPIPRFWFLETVARMPYFSYISMLHLYESLGWWRRSAEIKRVHFAEEWNEFHHLLIMEALGGDQLWSDRFLAQHAAIVYYTVLVVLWLLSPTLAYNFSQLIEAHAVDSYGEFRDANKELLSSLPAPAIAKQYYEGDPYLFDEFQSCRAPGSRRPEIKNLYDVVCAIADDEAEHVATMRACQDPQVLVKSPNTEAVVLTVGALTALAAAGVNTLKLNPEAIAQLAPEAGVLGEGAAELGFLAALGEFLLGPLGELAQLLESLVTTENFEALSSGVAEGLAPLVESAAGVVDQLENLDPTALNGAVNFILETIQSLL